MASRNLTRWQFATTTLAVGADSVLLGKTALGFLLKSDPEFADPFRIVTLWKSGLKPTFPGL
jgi:hypothetical protein